MVTKRDTTERSGMAMKNNPSRLIETESTATHATEPSSLSPERFVTTELFERYVDADTVGTFLSMPRREVLKLTREGKLSSYLVSGKVRRTYKYKLSEIVRDLAKLRKPSRMTDSSPSESAKEM
jgi:hypothetical protein